MTIGIEKREKADQIPESKERFPFFPPPYVIEKNGDTQENQLSLLGALDRIVDVNSEKSLLEERRKKLTRRLEVVLNKKSHGRSRKANILAEISRQYEREKRRRPKAIEYPLIDLILRSSKEKPFEIPNGVSPLSDNLPKEGDRHPFYSFVCERDPKDAHQLLVNPDLEILYALFSLRSDVYQQLNAGQISKAEARGRIAGFGRDKVIPEETVPIAQEIARKFQIS